MPRPQLPTPLFPYTTLFRSLTDGRVLTKRIEHAIGSLERPMSDADLERKFKDLAEGIIPDRKSTRLNSSHVAISYAVFCLKKKNKKIMTSYRLCQWTATYMH